MSAVETQASPKAQPFKLRAPLLEKGRQDTPLFATDLMWAHIKVYAEGGENDLHAHMKEEHVFIVLEGQCTIWGEDGVPLVMNRYDGVLLPMGTRYRLQSTGATNLVMLRLGAGSNFRLPGKFEERQSMDGMRTDKPVQLPGKFFGA